MKAKVSEYTHHFTISLEPEDKFDLQKLIRLSTTIKASESESILFTYGEGQLAAAHSPETLIHMQKVSERIRYSSVSNRRRK